MPESNNGATTIASGTVGGLLAFFDYLIERGIASVGTVGPLKSAARQVFETVEGTEDIDEFDVRSLDVNEYLDRFEVKTRGTGRYQSDSLRAYRQRFTRGVEQYITYITTNQLPKPKLGPNGGARRSSADTVKAKVKAKSTPSPVQTPAASTEVADGQAGAGMISYPFPLAAGGIASLRLPVRLERADAERIAAFIRTLVFEPQKQLGTASVVIADDEPEPRPSAA